MGNQVVRPRPWLKWLEGALWAVVGLWLLVRCVLPSGGESLGTLGRFQVEASGKPVLVVFDGSR